MIGSRVGGLRSARCALLALAVGLVLAGCTTGPGPFGPVRSPTGIVYEPGIPPSRTSFSQTAMLLLSQGVMERALERALEGVAADSTNPIHYFLAGLVQVRIGEYEDAHEMFTIAQRIYPAYELDIEPERAAAWVRLYNEGTEAYNNGEIELAIEAWERAAMIYGLAPEAPQNLATVYVNEGRYEEAIRASQLVLASLEKRPATYVLDTLDLQVRADAAIAAEATLSRLLLFTGRYEEAEPILRRRLGRDSANLGLRSDLASSLARQGRQEEALVIYTDLLSAPDLSGGQLFDLGLALFRARTYDLAGEAFGRLTRMRPHSRDAWFNYANALFGAADWEELLAVGPRLLELDPLGEKAGLLGARALLEMGDPDAALVALGEVEALPVYVEGLQMRSLSAITRLEGLVVGNTADEGLPVTIRFLFFDDADEVGSETYTLAAPPEGESTDFEVQFSGSATGYRYELVSAAGADADSMGPSVSAPTP